MKRMFQLIDTSRNGGVDFIEFVVAIINFGARSRTPRSLSLSGT